MGRAAEFPARREFFPRRTAKSHKTAWFPRVCTPRGVQGREFFAQAQGIFGEPQGIFGSEQGIHRMYGFLSNSVISNYRDNVYIGRCNVKLTPAK